VTSSQGIKIMATKVAWARIAVPEEAISTELLVVLLGFAWLVGAGRVSQLRKSAV
jgi:hypothetical protein